MTPTPPLSTAVADLDLPPLPKAECLLPGVYTYRASHMEAYARAAVVAALARSAAPAPADGLSDARILELARDADRYHSAAKWNEQMIYFARAVEREARNPWAEMRRAIPADVDAGFDALAAPASDIAAEPEQQQDHVAPPFAAPASQHDAGLLSEILALASLGSSYGLLADNYCGQIVEKIKAAAPCAHCGRAPADSGSCDWIECPAGGVGTLAQERYADYVRECRERGLKPASSSAYAVVCAEVDRDICAKQASRFRAQGGDTNDDSVAAPGSATAGVAVEDDEQQDEDRREQEYFDRWPDQPAPAEVSPPDGAMPRIPTEAMLNAARDWSVKKMGCGVGNGPATECWQAMYDAAQPAEPVDGAMPEQAAARATTESAPASAAPPELPAILFDGHAVYKEVLTTSPNPPRTSPHNVAEVLDAVVRLMRAPSNSPVGAKEQDK